MRVCHVNLAGGFSGGERQTLNLVSELARQGIDQALLARPGKPLMAEARDLGIPLHAVSHPLAGHRRWRATPADLLHAHDGRAVYWAALEHRVRGTPYLVTRRVDNPLGRGRGTRWAYGHAAEVVCLSTAIREAVAAVDAGISTRVIPSSWSGFPVDPGEVGRIRASAGGRLLVGQVGSLIRHKGCHVTVEAARRLAGTHPDVLFLLIGDGSLADELQTLARDLPNVRFEGYQSRIGNWLAALDILVFPSLSEGLGSTILEAWHLGTPVIASRAGGIVDLVEDGRNGRLVPPGNAGALAEAVAVLAGDRAAREALSAAGREEAERYSPAAMAARYASLYGELRGRPGGPAGFPPR